MNKPHSRTFAAQLFAAGLLFASGGSIQAIVRYVDLNCTHATLPYTNWATAATSIQDAVDACLGGDEILVTNGTYAVGVVVDKPLIISSVNGAWFTTIDGRAFGTCAYLTNGASLSGFTLTNGTVVNDGWGPGGGGVWCESSAAVVSNCVIAGNSAGGAYGGTLNNCTLTGNDWGAVLCTLNNCSLTCNSGFGADSCTLNSCTLTGNSGGGAYGCTLNNCIVYFNTVTGTSYNYHSSCTFNYCCTTPLPTNGIGNISSDPQLASASHLSASSPCRGAGNTAYATGTDIDGEAWAIPPSIGADEYHPGALTGPLTVGISPAFTNVAVSFPVRLTARIEGRTDLSVWDFGDGTVAANQPYAAHIWAAPGDYLVSLWAFNDSYPAGTSAAVVVHVLTGLHYVARSSASPVAPYTSWGTAATNIQQAVDAAEAGALVLVTNGLYDRVVVDKPLSLRSVNGAWFTTIDGRALGTCVYLTSEARLSGFTVSNGFNLLGGGVRCESSTAVVSECVLRGNKVHAFSDPINLFGASGGGVYGGTLNNCVLCDNVAQMHCDLGCALADGSAAAFAMLNNCSLVGNWSDSGAAVSACTLNNCIVYFNTNYYYSPSAGYLSTNVLNYDSYCTLNYCCTMPQPTDGLANITNAPLFVDTNGWSNLRLQSNSPCINAGRNALAPAGPDLDANPRIRGGTVDIGAYEFQSPTSLISYAWLQQYGLPTDGSADFADPDSDGLNNWQEWRCGTDPTNALSALRLLAPSAGGTNVTVTWQSVAGVNYLLERATNLSVPLAFTSLATNIPGQPGTTTYIDTNSTRAGPFFYRVGVNVP
jgi:hypothetical protein